MARGARVRARADRRRLRRGRGGGRDVRAAGLLRVAPRAHWPLAVVQRIRRHVRPARRDLGLLAAPRVPPCPMRSAPTSRRRTGSRPRPRSPTPPSRSRARRPTPSPASAPPTSLGFVVAQLAGAALATVAFRWLVPASPRTRPGAFRRRRPGSPSCSPASTTRAARRWRRRGSTRSPTRRGRAPSRRAPSPARASIAEVVEAMREVGIDLSSAAAAAAHRRARARRGSARHDGLRRGVPRRAGAAT